MSTIKVGKNFIRSHGFNNTVFYSISIRNLYDRFDDHLKEKFDSNYLDKNFVVMINENNCNVDFRIADNHLVDVNSISSDLVEVDEYWIKTCWKTFCIQLDLIKSKSLIYSTKPNIKSEIEIITDIIDTSIRLISCKKYNESIELLKTGLKYDKHEDFNIILYNMSCTYSLLKNEEETFIYLNKAIEAGYNNWKHAIMDSDFENYNTHPNFILALNKMKSK